MSKPKTPTQPEPEVLGPDSVAAPKRQAKSEEKLLTPLFQQLHDVGEFTIEEAAFITSGVDTPSREQRAALLRMIATDSRFDLDFTGDVVRLASDCRDDEPPSFTPADMEGVDDGEMLEQQLTALAAPIQFPGTEAAATPDLAPGKTVLQVVSQTAMVHGEAALAAMTPEERQAALLVAYQKRGEQMASLARQHAALGVEASQLQGSLNEVREHQKETAKQLAEMARQPIEEGIQMRIPGVALATAAQPAVPPQTDAEAEKVFDEGMAAAKAGKGEHDCPIMSSLGRRQWLDGWRQHTRKSQEPREAVKLGISFEKLQGLHRPDCLPASEKAPAVDVIEVYDAPHLVVGVLLDASEEGGYPFIPHGIEQWHLQPLYTKDEWSQLWEEKYGRAVEGFDQTDEAKDQRRVGGVDCGRVVKVGRKKYIVGPRSELLVLTTGEVRPTAPTEDEPRAAPRRVGKDAAAGD